jgi:hypothetical protein
MQIAGLGIVRETADLSRLPEQPVPPDIGLFPQ